MKIQPAEYLRGVIELPGDKSISHRSAIFSAMADGETLISNFATSADCASTLACIEKLGVGIVRDGSEIIITGVGKNGFTKPSTELDCGNSGTTMRLLSGVLAGQGFDSVMIGDESLSKRPMKRVIDPLQSMGVEIAATNNHAPLKIYGKNPLRASVHELKVASAQIKSCLLLAGLNADGETSVIERTPTRDHTERMLRWLGADLREEDFDGGKKLTISGKATLTARDISVPADISSAAFFLVAAACLTGSEIVLPNVGYNASRRAIIDVLQRFGADITVSDKREVCNEPVATLTVKGGLRQTAGANLLNGPIIANLIDEIPILAIFATQLKNGMEIRDAAELRVKESDRISAVVENLHRMNADVEEFPDGFRIGRSNLKGAVVDSFGDHRIAMAFAVAGLFADGETEIIDADCAAVSFPEFFDTFGKCSANFSLPNQPGRKS